ncbi:UvrD-helicase domain-containing protein [Streptomyces sp. NPDC058459]|uniref:UvrD-helicase domain-containing protein n=1 Tax=Streptomyces sp. NPDC058459 TaxID=3346508 RepID=UPI003659A1BB
MNPTPEQAEAIETYSDGLDMVLQAGAGCGKSATLKMIARSDSRRRMTYVAYNASIAADARRSFPTNVVAKTGHGLAYDPRYGARLQRPRQTAHQAAQALDVRKILGIIGSTPTITTDIGHPKAMTSKIIMRIALDTVTRWCYSADPEITAQHVPQYDGLTKKKAREQMLALVLPVARAAWQDLLRDDSVLNLNHDHYLKCQPPGTLVRVSNRVGGGYGKGGPAYYTAEVPIESIQPGEKVISWGGPRLGRLRKQGSVVTQVGQRQYDGALITATTASGRSSSYTHDHICVSMIGDSLDGRTVVYLMRRGSNYRVGRVLWRYGSQGNTLGLNSRIRSQNADAVWVLSAHDQEQDAALAEALVQHEFSIPGWQFQSQNEHMPLAQFWVKVGDNRAAAARCLRAHGRDILYPLWERGGQKLTSRLPLEVRACNLMTGMRVCEVDLAEPTDNGTVSTGGWTNAWQQAEVTRAPYSGLVHSIEVDQDHTYIADGIVTHNCWALSEPRIPTDVVLLDEAQDTNDVLSAVLLAQEHAQRIAVGDSAQQIYSWRGANDALATFTRELGCPELTLSQSFRFGPEIAARANIWLQLIDAPLRLTGWTHAESHVGLIEAPDAILCRTNAGAMGIVMEGLAAGRKVALVGGGSAIKQLAWAAEALQGGRPTDHPELMGFASWDDVRQYAFEEDGSLEVLVKLIDEHGPDRIVAAADGLCSEQQAELVVSTAHRAKGREWPAVRIHGDFRAPKPDQKTGLLVLPREEGRLAYVAVTRARERLDDTALAWVRDVTAVSS